MSNDMKSLLSVILITILIIILFPLPGSSAKIDTKILDDELILAAYSGDIPNINKLLKKGANVNATGQYGDTPLIRAAMQDNVDVVKLLLSAEAKINTSNQFGYSPLLAAVENKKTAIVKLLLSKGADINCKNYCGATPLIFASRNADIEMVQLLLDNGATVNAKDCHGRTALDLTKIFERDIYKGDWPVRTAQRLQFRGTPQRVVSPKEQALRKNIQEILLNHGAQPGSRPD